MTTPWLSDEEVDELCAPLVRNAAKVRYLRDVLKLAVKEKPNGRPLVMRSNVEAVLGGLPGKKPPAGQQQRAPVGPNVAGLVLAFSGKGR